MSVSTFAMHFYVRVDCVYSLISLTAQLTRSSDAVCDRLTETKKNQLTTWWWFLALFSFARDNYCIFMCAFHFLPRSFFISSLILSVSLQFGHNIVWSIEIDGWEMEMGKKNETFYSSVGRQLRQTELKVVKKFRNSHSFPRFFHFFISFSFLRWAKPATEKLKTSDSSNSNSRNPFFYRNHKIIRNWME